MILYAIRPMLDTLNRLATWIDNLPGMQDFLNPRCGQPICFGQSPAAYVIVVVSFLSILLFCSLGIARVRRRAAHAHDRHEKLDSGETTSSPLAGNGASDLVQGSDDEVSRAKMADEQLIDSPGAVVAEDETRGWMFREFRAIRLVNGRFALRLLPFDSQRTAALRQIPECSYDSVDRSLYLPASRESARALNAFAEGVSVLWTTDAWHKAAELAA